LGPPPKGRRLPALAGVLERLHARIVEEVRDEQPRTPAVLGGAMMLLALVAYAHLEDMRHQFPDARV
jgi:hypothetical protein